MPVSASSTVSQRSSRARHRRDEVALAARIEPAHPAQMRGEEAAGDEVGERRLQEERRVLAGDASTAVLKASTSAVGTTRKPTRSDGKIVLRSVPT